MDHERQIEPARETDLLAERVLLRFGGRVPVVEVETGLSDRDDARRLGQPLEVGPFVVELRRVVGMQPDGRAHIRMAARELDGLS